jgi:PPOX class probable F420-dependent enzyme
MDLSQWQRELVENARVARLGTVARDGRPALVPVCYALVDDRFVIAIDEKPKSGRELGRLRHLRRDPRAALLIDHYDDDWTRLAWLRFEGEAVTLSAREWPAAITALRSRYPQYAEMDLDSAPLIVFSPRRVVAWRW